MKKKLYLITALVVIITTGCRNYVSNCEKSAEIFEQNPVTIKWHGSKDEGLKSFQANVRVYTMNNRTDSHAKLQESYRISLKKIGAKMYTRIDFPANQKAQISARSMLSNGKDFIMIDTASKQILQQMSLKDEIDPQLDFLKLETALSRVDLNRIIKEVKELSSTTEGQIDMKEDAENGIFELSVNPDLLSKNQADKLISSTVRFDMHEKTLNEVETVHLKEDGSTVSSKTTILYKKVDGVPVKIGSVNEIDNNNPNKITGISENMPVYESEDDIPTISKEELAEMEANGTVVESVDNLVFGDPGDLSYKETVAELYQDIEVNAVPEERFKAILNEE